MDDEDDDFGLLSIAGLLVGLAILAERAAYRSFAHRWFVLWVLRWALTVGLDFVVQETSASWSRHKTPLDVRCRRADAMRLAMVLRALGAALVKLVRKAARFRALRAAVPSPGIMAARCWRDGLTPFPAPQGALGSPCPDTS